MNARVVVLTVVCVLLLNGVALADDCTRAVSLRKGEVATCNGVLFPPSWATSAIRCIDVDLPQCKNDSLLKLNRCRSTLLAEQQKFEVCSTTLLETQRLLETANQTTVDPWYKSPWLWASVGLVVGVSATIGVTYAVNQR